MKKWFYKCLLKLKLFQYTKDTKRITKAILTYEEAVENEISPKKGYRLALNEIFNLNQHKNSYTYFIFASIFFGALQIIILILNLLPIKYSQFYINNKKFFDLSYVLLWILMLLIPLLRSKKSFQRNRWVRLLSIAIFLIFQYFPILLSIVTGIYEIGYHEYYFFTYFAFAPASLLIVFLVTTYFIKKVSMQKILILVITLITSIGLICNDNTNAGRTILHIVFSLLLVFLSLLFITGFKPDKKSILPFIIFTLCFILFKIVDDIISDFIIFECNNFYDIDNSYWDEVSNFKLPEGLVFSIFMIIGFIVVRKTRNKLCAIYLKAYEFIFILCMIKIMFSLQIDYDLKIAYQLNGGSINLQWIHSLYVINFIFIFMWLGYLVIRFVDNKIEIDYRHSSNKYKNKLIRKFEWLSTCYMLDLDFYNSICDSAFEEFDNYCSQGFTEKESYFLAFGEVKRQLKEYPNIKIESTLKRGLKKTIIVMLFVLVFSDITNLIKEDIVWTIVSYNQIIDYLLCSTFVIGLIIFITINILYLVLKNKLFKDIINVIFIIVLVCFQVLIIIASI